nr:hypothetical protein [Thermoflexibacter sp.]
MHYPKTYILIFTLFLLGFTKLSAQNQSWEDFDNKFTELVNDQNSDLNADSRSTQWKSLNYALKDKRRSFVYAYRDVIYEYLEYSKLNKKGSKPKKGEMEIISNKKTTVCKKIDDIRRIPYRFSNSRHREDNLTFLELKEKYITSINTPFLQ